MLGFGHNESKFSVLKGFLTPDGAILDASHPTKEDPVATLKMFKAFISLHWKSPIALEKILSFKNIFLMGDNPEEWLLYLML